MNILKLLRSILLVLLVIIFLGFIWSRWGRVGEAAVASGEPVNIVATSFGNPDSANGNIIGIQPWLTAISYANEASFYQQLLPYLQVARDKGYINAHTIVVFPEYIGSWLVAANEKSAVYNPELTISDALTLQVSSNLFSFIPAYFKSSAADKPREALFRMKQPEMVRIYQSVFSRLAKSFGVTIVAGSTVLADPVVSDDGEIKIGTGKLYNTAAVFDGNGKVLSPLIKKIFPISDEQGFTCAADTTQAPLFTTPAGTLAVLVCADSWFPAAYTNLVGKADVIAIPSLGGTDSIWTSFWNGYNGFPPPADVDTLNDYHHITEGDAWVKYAMPGRAPKAGIHNGMNVFFSGQLWEMHPEGRVLTLAEDSLHLSSPAIHEGRITNLWFKKNN